MGKEFDLRILLAGVVVLVMTYLQLEARQQRLELKMEVREWRNVASKK